MKVAIPGELAERYEPVAVLGKGNMGCVLRCRRRTDGLEVALKLALVGADGQIAARMEREAKVLAQINHPGVVQVYDGGKASSGELYLVLELLDGKSLDQLMPMDDPFSLILDVSRTLQAVHEAEILHRDVKPANIMLTSSGRTVLVDFGLVQDPNRTRLTETGALLGSPAYMAPEIFQGRGFSRASDWYAMGVTAYALVEGKIPYERGTYMEIFAGVPPPPMPWTKLEPGDPRRILIERMTAVDPDRRIQDLGPIEEALVEGIAPEELEEATGTAPMALVGATTGPHASLTGTQVPGPQPEGGGGGIGRKLLWVALLLFAGVGFFLPGTETAPAPAPVTEVAPDRPDIPSLATFDAERRQALRAALAGARKSHRVVDRTLGVSWAIIETPRWMEKHAEATVGKDSEAFLALWEGLTRRTLSWLTRLRDWGKEAGDPMAALQDREARAFLDEEVLPVLVHLLEDFQLQHALISDPSKMDVLTDVGTSFPATSRAFRNVCADLRFGLEEWGEARPPSFLFVESLLPPDGDAPVVQSRERLERIETALLESRTPTDRFHAARALAHTLVYAPEMRVIPWELRRQSLRSLEGLLLESPESFERSHRALLLARCAIEEYRLSRSPGRPDEYPDILEEVNRLLDALQGQPPELVYWVTRGARVNLVGTKNPSYLPARPPEGMKAHLESRLLPLHEKLHAELAARYPEMGRDPVFYPLPAPDGRGPELPPW